MMGICPHVLIKKFVDSTASADLAAGEEELQRALNAGLPSLSLSKWPRATLDDCHRGSDGYGVDGFGNKLAVNYLGARESPLGVYLYLHMRFFDLEYVNSSIEALPMLRSISEVGMKGGGMIMIGQTDADCRTLGAIIGRRSDVFLYQLGERTGLNEPTFPDQACNRDLFPRAEFLGLVSDAMERDNIVVVKGTQSRHFLKECFAEIGAKVSRKEFDQRFGPYGVRWRRSTLFDWVFGT